MPTTGLGRCSPSPYPVERVPRVRAGGRYTPHFTARSVPQPNQGGPDLEANVTHSRQGMAL
jgi:hypothetical protein